MGEGFWMKICPADMATLMSSNTQSNGLGFTIAPERAEVYPCVAEQSERMRGNKYYFFLTDESRL